MKKISCVSLVALSVFMLLSFAFSVSSALAYSASVSDTEITQGGCTTLTWSGFGDTCEIWVYRGSEQWVDANLNAPYQGTQEICTDGWKVRDDYKIRVEDKVNSSIYVYTQTFAVNGLVPHLSWVLLNGGVAATTDNLVYISHSYTVTEPKYYMASENSNFSGATWKTYNDAPRTFYLSDGAGMKFVYFKYKNEYGESNVLWDNISYEPIMYYSLSGYARDESNQSIGVVTISGFPEGSINTDENGYYYVDEIVSTWSGTITPSKSGYTFDPSSKSFSELTADTTQNFTAILDISYSWQVGDYGACNDTCGGGRKTRVVECIRSTDSQPVDYSYCTSTKPDTISYDCPSLGPSRLCNDMGGEVYE